MADYPAPSSPERFQPATRMDNGLSHNRSQHMLDASPSGSYRPVLERQGESMPRLKGASSRMDDVSSRYSGSNLRLNANAALNQSMDTLKPLKATRSLMKATGSNIMAASSTNRLHQTSSGALEVVNSKQQTGGAYPGVSVAEMIKSTA